MNIITLDFETRFDSDYSLKKLTTEAYVRDVRFEVLGCGIRWPDGASQWLTHEQAKKVFAAIDWSRVVTLAHHSHFDLLVLNHVYNVRPRLILDTLSMARMVLGTATSLSLESLATRYGLPAKSVPYNLFKGKRWADLTPAEQDALAKGCLHDVDLTWRIFLELSRDFPEGEYPVVDATVRMFTEPSLEGDRGLLGKIWTDEQERKSNLLAELGLGPDDLQSSQRFAGLLRAAGVEPDTKPSPADPGRRTYAFAKTDDFMRGLAEEDSEAGDLARARLGIKSSIVQTRAERLGDMSTRGPLCIYLAPYAAHTLRWGGGDKTNFQNFPRKGDMRKAIVAPNGYLLAKADASQIECRLLNMLAGQWDVIELFRNGEDPYIGGASMFYNEPVYKPAKDDPRRAEMEAKRGLGKQMELSGGYGSGADTFKATAKKGTYGPPIILTDEEALRARDLYRRMHKSVVDYWGTADWLMPILASKGEAEWGPMMLRNKRIYLPGGTWLNFDSLEWDQDSQNWRYQTRAGWQKIWGSSLVAETTQALARVLTARVIAEARRNGLKVVWTTHDDVVLLVKDDGQAETTLEWLKAEMVRVPEWLPELPLAVEGELVERYG